MFELLEVLRVVAAFLSAPLVASPSSLTWKKGLLSVLFSLLFLVRRMEAPGLPVLALQDLQGRTCLEQVGVCEM